MREKAVRAIADNLGATSADELMQRLGEESMIRESSLGFCLVCGHEHEMIEPDEANRTCGECGARSVAGMDTIMSVFLFANEDKINGWLEPEKGILRKKIEEADAD